MIKLTLNLQSQTLKVMADFNADQQPTIVSFLQRVIDICGLTYSSTDLELFEGDYILPHLLSTKYLQQGKSYEIKLRNSDKKVAIHEKKDQKINNKKQAVAVKNVPSHSSSSDESESEKPRKINNKINKVTVPQKVSSIPKVQPKGSSVSSSSSSSSLPRVPVSKKNPPSKTPNQKALLFRRKPDSSDSEEEKMELKRKGYAERVKSILQSAKEQTLTRKAEIIKEDQKPKHIQKSKPAKQLSAQTERKPSAIPMSVRNKIQKKEEPSSTRQSPQKIEKPETKSSSSFKQHLQRKWISITKQVMTQYKLSNPELSIIEQKNEIRFKVIELDEEKFIPVTSGWINGSVTKIQTKTGNNLHIFLENVNKQKGGDTEFLKQLDIPMYNMQELQINKNTLSERQKALDKSGVQQKASSGPQAETQATELPPGQVKNTQSVEQFVCGQINYYFSDKNYKTDLFMQMHANKDPEKYVECRLMLNFPKIRKTGIDEAKVWSYLAADTALRSRTYELDMERKMIRKKPA